MRHAAATNDVISAPRSIAGKADRMRPDRADEDILEKAAEKFSP